MDIDENKAKQTLHDVESGAKDIRGRISYGIAGPILALWGAIWIICFSMTHFAPRIAGWGWIIGDAIGILGSILVARLHKSARGVQSDSAKKVGWRLLGFWLLLFAYAGLWLMVFKPQNAQQTGMFFVTLVMFAYVVMGLWLEMRFLLWLGLAVTAIAAAGYFLSSIAHGYLNLWLGVACGSALLVAGLYLMLRWR